jgi:1-acyl-sn-glycerol-3-phosphate acyltransferase
MKLELLARAAAQMTGTAALRAGRGLYAAYLGLLIAAVAAMVWIPVALVPSRRLARLLSRAGARLLLSLAGCRVSREGGAALAGTEPVLLASHHASYVDVLVLLALVPRDFVFAAKAEVGSWPFLGTLVRRAGHLTVERFDVSQSVADAGKLAPALERGQSVLLVPEGTFTSAAGLRPFRLGTFKAAVETGVPVVPLALRGTRAILRAGQMVPRPGRAHLWIGDAIAPAGEGWRAVVELRDRVAADIAAHSPEPRLDLVAGGPPRD